MVHCQISHLHLPRYLMSEAERKAAIKSIVSYRKVHHPISLLAGLKFLLMH